MKTRELWNMVSGDGRMMSWERWDNIKHTEWFVFLSAIIFVILFSWLFARSPVIGATLDGYHSLARTILIWAIFALAFNLLLGQTGLLSFGHAMFLGGASYAAALFAIHVYGDPILMLLAGVLFALVIGFFAAFILLRLHTVYFAIITLAMAQMLFYFAREPFEPITNGENGLTGIRIEPLFGIIPLRERFDGILGTLFVDRLYIFIGILFVVVVVFIVRIRKSPYGLIFKAIRENETRTSFVGLDVWRYKFAAFMLSGGIAGIAGSLLTIESQFAGIRRLYWEASGELVVMTILGGLGTIVGPIVGTIIFLYFEGVVDGFAYIGRYWLLLLATAFTAIVWMYPDGFWGMVTSATSRIPGRGGEE